MSPTAKDPRVCLCYNHQMFLNFNAHELCNGSKVFCNFQARKLNIAHGQGLLRPTQLFGDSFSPFANSQPPPTPPSSSNQVGWSSTQSKKALNDLNVGVQQRSTVPLCALARPHGGAPQRPGRLLVLPPPLRDNHHRPVLQLAKQPVLPPTS